ncbi:hypothetical protein ACWD4N_37480 [Streptomyces sp. NPDC002586]
MSVRLTAVDGDVEYGVAVRIPARTPDAAALAALRRYKRLVRLAT